MTAVSITVIKLNNSEALLKKSVKVQFLINTSLTGKSSRSEESTMVTNITRSTIEMQKGGFA